MAKKQIIHWTAAVLTVAVLGYAAYGEDWPTWGNGPNRNMVSNEKGIVTDFDPDADFSSVHSYAWMNERPDIESDSPDVSSLL